MTEAIPHLWYADRAEEAVRLYTSLVPNSHVDSVSTMPAESPAGPADSVVIVSFTLAGRPYLALQAGPLDAFNHSFSIVVTCGSQDEIDRLWEGLSEGGSIEQCGWLKDRYGLSWQIVPAMLGEMMKDSDRVRGKRVAEAMLKMIKLDIARLQRAYDGV